MIIDSHCHLTGEGWMSHGLVRGIGRMAAAAMGKEMGDIYDPDTLMGDLLPLYSDTTGEKLVSAMDIAGVDRTCIFAADFGLCTGEPEVSIREQNGLIAQAAKRFPDRLIPYFAIDPRRPEALDMFRQAMEEGSFRGLKLHPTSGFYPYDPIVYPFYEKCLSYNIPVLFHTGSTCAPLKSRFAQPIYLDDVAADFPDLTIIMAHVGLELWKEALMVANVKPNIFLDISGWQTRFSTSPGDFYNMLRIVIDTVGPWRVLFGSDGPFLELTCPLDRWVKALKEPDSSFFPNITFTSGEIEIVMGKAVAKLLKLE